jgi:hypothetical protein
MTPTFTLRIADGVRSASIFEILSLCKAGEIFEFEQMAELQRAPTVLFFAVLLRLADHFSPQQPGTPLDFETIFSGVAFDLTPDAGAAGLLQPVLPGEYEYAPIDFNALQGIWSAAEHAVKSVPRLPPESAAFALLASMHGSSASAAHFQGAVRAEIATVLVSDNGTAASEIRHLADALDLRPAETVAEHLLWTQPYRTISAEDVPLPFLAALPFRLEEEEDGVLTAHRAACKIKRVDGSWYDDPHVARSKDYGAPYKMFGGRDFSFAFRHNVLFGSERNSAARILDGLEGPKLVRISGLHSAATNNLGGFHSVLLKADLGLWSEARQTISTEAIGIGKVAQQILSRTVALTLQDGDGDPKAADPRVPLFVEPVINLLEAALFDETVRLMALSDEDLADGAARRSFEGIARASLTALVEDLARNIPILAVARALDSFDMDLVKKLGGPEMPRKTASPVEIKIYAILGAMEAEMEDEDRHALRRAGHEHDNLFVMSKFLRFLPPEDQGDPDRMSIWMAALAILAKQGRDGPPLGRALGESRYPQDRMSRLLASKGANFITECQAAFRMLGDRPAALAQIIAFALTGDKDIGLSIGQDYWRAARRA